MRPQLLLAAITAFASAGCYSPGDGQAPHLDELYFPTGLALDKTEASPRYLYVASSDFDLQFRSAGLIGFDLDRVRAEVPRNCSTSAECATGERCDTPAEARADTAAALPDSYIPSYVCVTKGSEACSSANGEQNSGEQSAADRLLYPGRCKAFDQRRYIHSTVGIGAFATNVIFAKNPDPSAAAPEARLFLPVRGDATLHWIDLSDGQLNCDQQSTSDGSCGDSHRAGHDPAESNNNIFQPSEPFGADITDDGKYVAVTNQTAGSISLYRQDWAAGTGPELTSIVGGLPQAPVAIAAVPQISDATSPGFLVAYRNAAQVDLLRVLSGDPRPSGDTLAYAGTAAIPVNSLGYDSRDILIDDSKRTTGCAAMAGDQAAYAACLRAGPQPDIFLANRTPASLIIGTTTADPAYRNGSSDLPAFSNSISLTSGPSRMALGKVRVPVKNPGPTTLRDEHGIAYELEPRVFIVCFDSTRIFVYDPKRGVIESIIETGRGPYAIAVDEARGLAYVGLFTDSYLSVVSLDQRYRQTYATVIANIGIPTPPRSSK